MGYDAVFARAYPAARSRNGLIYPHLRIHNTFT